LLLSTLLSLPLPVHSLAQRLKVVGQLTGTLQRFLILVSTTAGLARILLGFVQRLRELIEVLLNHLVALISDVELILLHQVFGSPHTIFNAIAAQLTRRLSQLIRSALLLLPHRTRSLL
jgi:hypothetical protein